MYSEEEYQVVPQDLRSYGLLADFVAYCTAHPEERFWQALRNWSGYNFIYGSMQGAWELYEPYMKGNWQSFISHLEDTYHKVGKK